MDNKFSKKNVIALIGCGKIAASLADAIIKSGYKIGGVFSRSEVSAMEFAEKFAIKNYSSVEELSNNCSVFILAVPDSQIKNAAQKLSKLNLDFSRQLFIHLSGAHDSSLLGALKKKGSAVASFHIMQTFSSKKIISIKKSYVSIETENKSAEKYLLKLSEDLELQYFCLSKSDKIQYHLAGVFASNFFVSNLYVSQLLFDGIKNFDGNFAEILAPIIKSTFENVKKNGAENSLSGPVERGDLLTVTKHLKFLLRFKNKDRNLFIRNYADQSLLALIGAERKNGQLSSDQKKIKMMLEKEIQKIC